MAFLIQITADKPEDLGVQLRALAQAFGGGAELAHHIETVAPHADAPGVTLAMTNPDKGEAPVPPAEQPATGTPAPTETPPANVVGALSPSEQRQKGIDMAMQAFNRDKNLMPELNKLRDKYAVKQFKDIPDDRAAEFCADVLLVVNGTGEVTKAA